jgi:hypothetical protein
LRNHFKNRKKLCEPKANDIALTNDVVEHVLKHGTYVSAQQPVVVASPTQVVNVTINQQIQAIVTHNNVVNQFIGSLDVYDKVRTFLVHTSSALVPFDQHVERFYGDVVQRLQDGHDVRYRADDFLRMVDDVTRWSGMDGVNVLYNAKADKVHIYDEGEWRDFIWRLGIFRIVEIIKENLLDHYEFALVRRMHSASVRGKQRCRESLADLYAFLAAFDLTPAVIDHSDDYVLNDGEDDVGSFAISDEAQKMYEDVRRRQATTGVNRLKREIVGIVKKNSASTVHDINRAVLQLFDANPTFRDVMLRVGAAAAD